MTPKYFLHYVAFERIIDTGTMRVQCIFDMLNITNLIEKKRMEKIRSSYNKNNAINNTGEGLLWSFRYHFGFFLTKCALTNCAVLNMWYIHSS